jgi:uncharacterized protein (DUF736 family)
MNGTREKNPDEIGALWTRTTQKCDEYLSGEINGDPVVIFQTHSRNPKAPTWRVMKGRPRQQARPSRVDDVEY